MTTDNKKTFAIPILFAIVALAIFTLAPKQSAAQNYVPLAPIEGTTIGPCATSDPSNPNCKTNLSVYLTGIFKVGVAGAGVLAFLMIVWGGFTYLSTDVITGKEEGKARIERAVGGLILALTSYIILNTINPKLVELDLYFGDAARQANRAEAPSDLPPIPTFEDRNLEIGRKALDGRLNYQDTLAEAKKEELLGNAGKAADLRQKAEVVRQVDASIAEFMRRENHGIEALKNRDGKGAQTAKEMIAKEANDRIAALQKTQKAGEYNEEMDTVRTEALKRQAAIDKAAQYYQCYYYETPHAEVEKTRQFCDKHKFW